MEDNNENEDRNQRRRIVIPLSPEDQAIANSTMMRRSEETSLFNLTDENYREESEDMMDERYIDLQLLRIITPDSSKGASIYQNRGRRVGFNRSKQEVHYTRMYLCRIFSVDHNQRCRSLVYIMQARNSNEDLWKLDIELRDNGTLTIGSIFRMIAPHFVEKYVNNEIPLLVSQLPVIIMKPPRTMEEVTIQQISGNQSLAFTLNGANLRVRRTTAIETTCSGNFCDKQRRNDLGSTRSCGCFNMSQHRTNIALEHSIRVIAGASVSVNMDHFSSSKFSSLYLSLPIPGTVAIRSLQHTDDFFHMKDKISDVVTHVNNNGGWTVIGWYCRGMINDRALMGVMQPNENETDNQVDAGDANYHFVSVLPTDRAYLDRNSDLGRQLVALKFDVSTLTAT
jgi:hypothetical protein